MEAFQFLFSFKIAAFFSFFSALFLYWMLKNERVSVLAGAETLALFLLTVPFKTSRYVLRFMSRILALISAAILNAAEIISVFLRAFYKIISTSVVMSYGYIRNRYIPVFFVGLFFFAGAATVSLYVQMPEPNTHDEFGYLLHADTFARGRLTNPTHPLWRHFESFHIIQHPSYTAKYPPAQGLFLAFGQVLTGRPIVGVWLSFALMMAALYWALKPFFTPGWTLLGTVLAGLRVGFIGQPYLANGFGYWSQSYWGGAVAAFGGALLFGSCRRLWEKPSVHLSVLLGLGLAILANSRPYEGLLASLPLIIAFPFWFFKDKRFSRWIKLSRVIAPLSAVLVITFSWMLFYNWRVVGDPLKSPYSVHEETYGMPPIFVGQETYPKAEINHSILKDYYDGYVQKFYVYHSTLKGFLDLTLFGVTQTWIFFFGVLLLIPLVFLRMRDFLQVPWTQFFGLVIFTMILGELPVERLTYPHYIAPVTFPFYYMVTLGLVRLNEWQFERQRLGGFAVGFIIILSLGQMMIPFKYLNEIPACAWHRDRAKLLRQLNSSQGQHLVIVRYAPDHSFHNEWVYNNADIDNSKVVWAREMSSPETSRLAQYFSGRHKWLLEVDKHPMKLVPYVEGGIGQ